MILIVELVTDLKQQGFLISTQAQNDHYMIQVKFSKILKC